MKLYGYWRSSAAYRVRIALHWKGLAFENAPVSLLRGEQARAEYLRLNPQGLVPTLVDGAVAIGQSLAILEYLEERWPAPPLLPRDAPGRARVRQLALAIAADTHPLQNIGAARVLAEEFGIGEDGQERWKRAVTQRGLAAFERLLAAGPTGRCCHADAPSFADACLIPQLYNARRFGLDVSALFPRAAAIEAHCLALPAFAASVPEAQPDAG